MHTCIWQQEADADRASQLKVARGDALEPEGREEEEELRAVFL